MAGYTLAEMKAMGATPVADTPAAPASSGGLTLDQMKSMGATVPQTPGLGSRIATDIKTAGETAQSAIAGDGQFAGVNPVTRGTQAAAAAANAIPQVASELLPKPVRDVAGVVGGAIGGVIHGLGNMIGSTQLAQDWAAKHPEAAKNLEAIANTTGALGQISNDILAAQGAASGAQKVVDVGQAAGAAVKQGVQSLKVIPENAAQILKDTQTKVASGNVQSDFGTSIDRLTQPNPSTKIVDIKSPLQQYDEYHSQALKANTDVKADSALAVVGSKELAPAVDSVISMKKAAGAQMGAEMDRVGGIQTDISHTFAPFEQELRNNGLTFDAQAGKILSSSASKVTAQDRGLLQTYINDLNELGANPTARELDAFVSRIPQELKVYKNANSIKGVTNGERMITGNLNQLKNSLSANVAKGGNPEFAGYAKAKANYAALSNFLDEGSGFVGKKTVSGDFAKDASLLKSSVQSLLNGGKKDWLLKLEALTGNPILDKATLALQAMKDAGDYRANSLLELLTPNSVSDIPLSKSGILGKALDVGFKLGKEKFVGTPAEQTRRFIQSRMDAGVTSAPR